MRIKGSPETSSEKSNGEDDEKSQSPGYEKALLGLERIRSAQSKSLFSTQPTQEQKASISTHTRVESRKGYKVAPPPLRLLTGRPALQPEYLMPPKTLFSAKQKLSRSLSKVSLFQNSPYRYTIRSEEHALSSSRLQQSQSSLERGAVHPRLFDSLHQDKRLRKWDSFASKVAVSDTASVATSKSSSSKTGTPRKLRSLKRKSVHATSRSSENIATAKKVSEGEAHGDDSHTEEEIKPDELAREWQGRNLTQLQEDTFKQEINVLLQKFRRIGERELLHPDLALESSVYDELQMHQPFNDIAWPEATAESISEIAENLDLSSLTSTQQTSPSRKLVAKKSKVQRRLSAIPPQTLLTKTSLGEKKRASDSQVQPRRKSAIAKFYFLSGTHPNVMLVQRTSDSVGQPRGKRRSKGDKVARQSKGESKLDLDFPASYKSSPKLEFSSVPPIFMSYRPVQFSEQVINIVSSSFEALPEPQNSKADAAAYSHLVEAFGNPSSSQTTLYRKHLLRALLNELNIELINDIKNFKSWSDESLRALYHNLDLTGIMLFDLGSFPSYFPEQASDSSNLFEFRAGDSLQELHFYFMEMGLMEETEEFKRLKLQRLAIKRMKEKEGTAEAFPLVAIRITPFVYNPFSFVSLEERQQQKLIDFGIESFVSKDVLTCCSSIFSRTCALLNKSQSNYSSKTVTEDNFTVRSEKAYLKDPIAGYKDMKTVGSSSVTPFFGGSHLLYFKKTGYLLYATSISGEPAINGGIMWTIDALLQHYIASNKATANSLPTQEIIT